MVDRRQLLRIMTLMVGGVASGSITRALQAAQNSGRVPAKPVFDPGRRVQVEVISELIIPTTDTPGAIAAGVPDFVEMMVGEWYTDAERDIFLAGLASLDDWCRQSYAGDFLSSTEAERTAALLAAEQQAAGYQEVTGINQVDEGTPFFTKVKELVVVGYYTSEIGARQEHKYFRMTRNYDGDYPLAKSNGRQWAY